MTPERKAEIEARLDEILGPAPLPKPKVVAVAGEVVRDADVRVSPADTRNSRYGTVETVRVRRADVVTINQAAAERQYWEGVRDREAERRYRRKIDPCNLGLYGPRDD